MRNRCALQHGTNVVALLKDFAKRKDLQKGIRLHADIHKLGLLEKDCYVASTLVNMYAKCGALVMAAAVLDELPSDDVVTWNSLITGYVQQGHGEEALKYFKQMLCYGFTPNLVTFTCILKACGSIGARETGDQIHREIIKRGVWGKDIILGTNLVDMYAKCSALAEAACVLCDLPVRDVVCWNALIAGYVQQGQGEEALGCFEQLQLEGFSPDSATFISTLKACGCTEAIEKGMQIHKDTVRQGLLEKDLVLGTALVDMYVKCGVPSKAGELLDQLPARNAVSWNAIIAGYTEQGQIWKALMSFEQMQCEGLCPDVFTFICTLKACGSIGAMAMGKRIHTEAVQQGFFGNDFMLDNALVIMYAKCGALPTAARVLDELLVRDVVSWTALVEGHVEHGNYEEALNCFNQMQYEGVTPNAVTLIFILKACGSIGKTDMIYQIHDDIVSQRLFKDIDVGTTLVDVYAKQGAFAKAVQVLDELPAHNIQSLNALVTGYIQLGQVEDALKCFEWMQREGVSPNIGTLVCILKAYSMMEAGSKGQQIHDEIKRWGLIEKNIVLGNSIVNLYAKCGALEKAIQVLEELPVRDITSWNALITGYDQEGQNEEVLKCFERMQSEGHSPSLVTFICTFKACGNIGAVNTGEKLYMDATMDGLVGQDLLFGNSLLNMYARCGALEKAVRVLDGLSVRNTVTWNVLISGYSQQGQGEEALKCFNRMVWEGIPPDAVTFTCVLNACSRAGLLEEGKTYFLYMNTKYGIIPSIEHFTCIVDLFVRAGEYYIALPMMKFLPFSQSLPGWHSVLGACRECGNMKLGRLAFDSAVQ